MYLHIKVFAVMRNMKLFEGIRFKRCLSCHPFFKEMQTFYELSIEFFGFQIFYQNNLIYNNLEAQFSAIC